MPKYELIVVKTYSFTVEAENEQDAYEKLHADNEYESCKYVGETTETVTEIGENNGLGN